MGELAYLPTTTTVTHNYQFIEHSFPALYSLSQEIEKYYAMDHSCCLLKTRLFVELWCHEVGEKLKLRPPVSGDLVNKIKQVASSQKVPDYIVDILNTLRVEGNRSAHMTQAYDGSWSCEYTLTKYKLDNLMKSLLEITQYLAYKLNLQSDTEQNEWQAPTKLALQEDILASLSGNKEATLSLAKHFVLKMYIATIPKKTPGSENKAQLQLIQHDLTYWLDRAHKQGHAESWLLYAEVYKNKLLQLPEKTTVENCFKEALKIDKEGEAAYQYASYLRDNAQHKRSLKFTLQAAELENHKAIQYLQIHYYEKEPKQYLNWVAKGIDAKVKQSFTLDLAYKLEAWENDKDNELLKKQAKSALISAQSYQSEGAKYFKGYCDYFGYWGKTPQPELGLKVMAESHQQLPVFMRYEHKLFNLAAAHSEYEDLALEVSTNALICCSDEMKPQMQFDFSMLLLKKLYTENKVKVESPRSIKALVRESAKNGCFDAQQYIKSPKGKAFLRDNSLVSHTICKKTADRKKLKQAKKKARKAKR
ncbi:DUF4145 domain-containing protein [Psychromonas sp. Urea-02u-13]|uniref:DUF4145 domain-containing protein n=1 Tax=Psychromonas sp. Urea-02u-13 TaxID=2058326 RepID=UPI000C3278D7|nr:DUF4145 domain-containing protein [Psychromonas sp. Urea-02u-13]PKG38327.1 hypothetical protein CXF74_14150 [Psychromonas sp. Urea-02u-13]